VKGKILHTAKFVIKPVAPFDFNLSVTIFSDGDRQISRYENGKFWQVIRINSKLALVTIKSLGNADEPRLSIQLDSVESLSKADKEKAAEIVRMLLNLDLDLKPFYRKVKKDGTLSGLILKLKGLKGPTTPTVFEALIDSIVEQQISLKVANSMEGKLTKTFGDFLRLNGEIYYAFPLPGRLASASAEHLRKCGLSLKKTEYVRGISRLIADDELDLEELKHRKDVDAVIKRLDRIRGIGIWTAEMSVVRDMQKFEALPADDLGLRRVISHYYREDKPLSAEETRRIARKWGKWKGLAAFYLIIAEWLNNESKS
jgi:DNA-3-methyladenine glycosylase II